MDIACIGGGPGGLYTALLLKKADPRRRVCVVDRNPPSATYGWGVVFSDETLGFLEEADPETYAAIQASFVRWEAIDTYYGGECIRSGGHAFSGMSRPRLLQVLQERCLSLGVALRFQEEVTDLTPFKSADLIVAADGVNSSIRQARAHVFKTSFDVHRTRFIWLGVKMRLPAFTFVFCPTEFGMFQAHAYPFDRETSTFIVECGESVWRRAGLDHATEQESLRFCERVFAAVLHGRPLLSNRSTWISFVTLRNENWRDKDVVLLGDAAHTAHFSVGSGTKMAMEDAIALWRALDEQSSLSAALLQYEELRQPVVERTQQAARQSSLWFEHVERYAHFEPTQFAFSLLTRSKRIDYENLRLRDPSFSARVDLWFARQAAAGGEVAAPVAPPPALNPYRIGGLALVNRLAVAPPGDDSAVNGSPEDEYLAHLEAAAGSAGLVMAPNVAVSAEGWITPRSTGIFEESHQAVWKRVVDEIHATSAAKVGLQLVHAGRRGATRPRSEGVDMPLPGGGWELLSASPIPYAPRGPTPAAMTGDAMNRVRSHFILATKRGIAAGFDLLELHFGHGYLLASFLSPLSNQRKDEYGGSLENRLRYPLEVLAACREVWPDEKPLSVCFSVAEWSPGGMTEDDAVAAARAFHGHGADAIHVVTGQTVFEANPAYGRAWEAPFGDLIRNEASVPVILGGFLSAVSEVNTLLAAGRADLCVVTTRVLAALDRSAPVIS